MRLLKFDAERAHREALTPETETPAPPKRRFVSIAQHGHYVDLTSLRHPLGYEHFQQNGWCEMDDQDLLGTDRWPGLTATTQLSTVDAIAAWRGRLRIWFWQDDETTLYDPAVYKRMARRYPYSTFVRDVQSSLEDDDAFIEKMDERWLARCPSDACAAVTFAAGGPTPEDPPGDGYY